MKAQLGASVLGGRWGEPSLQGGKRGWLLWVLFVKRSGGVGGFSLGGSDRSRDGRDTHVAVCGAWRCIGETTPCSSWIQYCMMEDEEGWESRRNRGRMGFL